MTDEKDKPGDEIEYIPEPPPDEAPPLAEKKETASPPQEKEPSPAPAGGETQAQAVPEGKSEKPRTAESHRALKEKLKKRDAEIAELKRQVAELKDQSLRRLAEMENQRKRFERERAEYQQYALSGLLLELVAVVDNFERALGSATAETDGKTFREGVELIHRMLQSLLAKHGVKPIILADRTFDPNLHHAMTVEESESVKEPTVESELQKGYMLHQRLLRPTLVKVLVPKKEP